MPKYIVCGIKSNITNVNREGVSYHGIPKNGYMRKQWLKVSVMDHCTEWRRICRDRFLEEYYKPGKKQYLFSIAIPQLYNRNGCPNYATQSNDVETGNNVILPMEQNIMRKEHIEYAAFKNRLKPGAAVPSLFLNNDCRKDCNCFRTEKDNGKN